MRKVLPALLLTTALAACGDSGSDDEAATPVSPQDRSTAEDAAVGVDANDELVLPAGFTATVVHEGIGPARHLAVRDNGDIYVMTMPPAFGDAASEVRHEGIVALRDEDGDHVADRVESFTNIQGTGIGFHEGDLYVSDNTTVYRIDMEGADLVPTAEPEVMISGFQQERQHADKPFTFDNAGNIYVNVGAPANACQEQMRSPGSPGMMPCPLLEKFGGIWRFDAGTPGQTQDEDGTRYATGMRNTIALAWNPMVNDLFAVIHGRDQLDVLWPDIYTARDNAVRPAEEFHRITEGGDYGWPYTFYDTELEKRVVAPEYGGDGERAPEESYPDPLIPFPAHWAPNSLLFYQGDMFPESYQGGAFIAFHGSWNRAPEPQDGYNVVFVPMSDGEVTGPWTVFAGNFTKGELEDNNPGSAAHRPVGLAVGPDGALYISDSQQGRIWRITYEEQ